MQERREGGERKERMTPQSPRESHTQVQPQSIRKTKLRQDPGENKQPQLERHCRQAQDKLI